jgi:hypothetical protein
VFVELHVIDSWTISNNWYQSKVEDLKLRLPRGGDLTSASGRAIVGRRSDRVKMASTPSSAKRRVIVFGGATWRRRQGAVIVKVVDEDDH